MRAIMILTLLFTITSCVDSELKYRTETITADNEYLSLDISYPIFTPTASHTNINTAIFEAIEPFQTENGLTIAEQISELTQSSQMQSENIPGMKYAIKTSYKVNFHGGITSIELRGFEYTGGAHPNSYLIYLNFNSNGDLIDTEDLTENKKQLITRAVELLCARKGFSKGDGTDKTNLFVELSELPLPENIGIVNDSLVLCYNLYEIAPYYEGITELKIPMSEGKHYLKDF